MGLTNNINSSTKPKNKPIQPCKLKQLLAGLILNVLSELKPSTIIFKTAGSSNAAIKFRCVLSLLSGVVLFDSM